MIDPQNEIESARAQRSTVPQLSTQRIDALIGKFVDGRFEILSVVGSGGMSVVYKAKHTAMDKIVALKILHPRLVSDSGALMRFQQEAKAASRISHPNVIGVHDFGMTTDGMPYLVMDFVEGDALCDLIEEGPLSLERALPIISSVCQALIEAHKLGIVHRDLKPSNIMLARSSEGEVAKVLDFGIAKILPTADGTQLQLTQTGEVFGSPLYMSPEQCLGKHPDQRSDIYSMGCLIFEVLSGRPPFVGATAYETIHKQVNDMPERLSSVRKDLKGAGALDPIILKAMAKEPSERYQSMQEMMRAIELAANPSGVRQIGQIKNILELLRLKWRHMESRGMRKKLLGAAAVVILSVLVFEQASVLCLPQSKPDEQRVEMLWLKDAVEPVCKYSPSQLQEMMTGVRILQMTEHHMLSLPTPTGVLIDMQLRLGNTLFEANQLSLAREEYVKAWRTMHYGDDPPELQRVHQDYALHGGDTFLALKNYQMAKDYYRLVLPLFERDALETGYDTSPIHAKLAYCYLHLGALDAPSAKKHFERAVKISADELDKDAAEHWLYVCSLADILRKQSTSGKKVKGSSEQEQALALYESARKYFLAQQGERSKNAGLCSYYMGQINAGEHEYGQAIKDFEAAAPALKTSFGDESPLYVDLLWRYSNALISSGNVFKAMEIKSRLKAISKI